jgi:DNA-binding LacI/PurR family transcriptional regulator
MLAMGRLAVETLLGRISNGTGETVRHMLQPELVVRGTTGPPPRGDQR